MTICNPSMQLPGLLYLWVIMAAGNVQKTFGQDATRRTRVLCLDDDPMMLSVLVNALGATCEVHTATTGREALVILREQEPFAVVIADMVMPGMDGITFLAEAEKIAPEMVRMLLIGNTDVSAAVAAVNRGHIYRFLTKPCDAAQIRNTVLEGIQKYMREDAARKHAAELLLQQKMAIETKHRHLSCLYALSRQLETLADQDQILSADILETFAHAVDRTVRIVVQICLDDRVLGPETRAFGTDVDFPIVYGHRQRGVVRIGRALDMPPLILTQDERNVLQAMVDRLALHCVGQEARRMAIERQQQLMKADKLASLGVMVAGIAHEINNPVNNVMLNASLLRDAMPEVITILDTHFREHESQVLGGLPYEEMRVCFPQMLRDILESCERIRAITEDLRDASHVNYEKYRDHVQVNHVVQHAMRLCSHMDRNFSERVVCELEEEMPWVACSQRRLEQVLINLLQNGWQCLEKPDAKLYVFTRYDPADDKVCIGVKDEGRGMPPSELERVKDPFFTTRRDQGGTGLGAFIANSIVEEMGGQLAFMSEEGVGTLAQIQLPAEEEA